MIISFKKTHPQATIPTQAHLQDAGFDLCCLEDFTLYPGETKMVDTGLKLHSVLSGKQLFFQILGRSGLASQGIFPVGGVIDVSYRGNIKVLLQNGNPPYKIPQATQPNVGYELKDLSVYVTPPKEFKAGDRIAQLVIQAIRTNMFPGCGTVSITEAQENESEGLTTRGQGGFGSTGT